MTQPNSWNLPTRRALLRAGFSALVLAAPARAPAAPPGFEQWRENFRKHALSKGISEATWTRAMGQVEPDMTVFKQIRNQPEFNEQIWQYINRRVSDWRIINGKVALKENAALFARIEKDFGVERGTLLALWGVESAYGDPAQTAQGKHDQRERNHADSEVNAGYRLLSTTHHQPKT